MAENEVPLGGLELLDDDELLDLTEWVYWNPDEKDDGKKLGWEIYPATRARFQMAKQRAKKRASRAGGDKEAAFEVFFTQEYMDILIKSWVGVKADCTKEAKSRFADQFPQLSNFVVERADDLLMRRQMATAGNSAR